MRLHCSILNENVIYEFKCYFDVRSSVHLNLLELEI